MAASFQPLMFSPTILGQNFTPGPVSAPTHSMAIPISSTHNFNQPFGRDYFFSSSPIPSASQTPTGLDNVFTSMNIAQDQYNNNSPFGSFHLTAPAPSLQNSPVNSNSPTMVYAFNNNDNLVYAPIPPQFTITDSPQYMQVYGQSQQYTRPKLATPGTQDSSRCSPNQPVISINTRSKLPSWCLTDSGDVGINLGMIVDRDLVYTFACDKIGCHFLQTNLDQSEPNILHAIFNHVLCNDVFNMLVNDVFGNFLVQKLLEIGSFDDKDRLMNKLVGRVVELCRSRYSCRVIQKALEQMSSISVSLVSELMGHELELAVDQNANHVIQRVFTHFGPQQFAFLVHAFVKDEQALRSVIENKYGCRVVQLSLEHLTDSSNEDPADALLRKQLLHHLLNALLIDGPRFTANEYANYVIQHIIVTDSLAIFREQIIAQCIRGKVLELSQEKYASHVVEKAFEKASRSSKDGQSPSTIDMLMDEVFYGYERGRDGLEALEIMMYDQFGNYVVQTMLTVAEELRHRATHSNFHWFPLIANMITSNRIRLFKYSSGKKIIEQLKSILSPAKGTPSKMTKISVELPENHRSHLPISPPLLYGGY